MPWAIFSETKTDMAKIQNVRAAVLESLIACMKHDKYSNLEVSSAIGKYEFSDADKRLFTRLVYGVIEKTVMIDNIIAQYSSRSLVNIDDTTLVCLRLGIYQLMFGDKIPDHAAVSETVAVSPKRSKGFVNAMLREFLRNDKKYKIPEGDIARLSFIYSCPEALCEFFIKHYGIEKSERILEAFMKDTPVYVKTNTLKTNAEALISEELKGFSVSEYSSDMIVGNRIGISAESALYFVEDLSSRLAVKALSAEKGNLTIDTCAAPGGKSFSIAMDMKNEGKLYSFDLHKNKLSLIKCGAERLGIDIIEVGERDARYPVEELFEKADRVLCDAPCSGLGVIGKKPDIKFKSLEDIKRLPEIQLAVLKGAAKYVKPGGVLVYSTCTLNPDENEAVVRKFLESDNEFYPDDFEATEFLKSQDGMLTVYPYDLNSDGFFISRLVRKL